MLNYSPQRARRFDFISPCNVVRVALLCAACLSMGCSQSASGQVLLWTVSGSFTYQGFGISIDAAGDINSDGVPDIVVGAPGTPDISTAFLNGPGAAFVLSGSTGAILRTWSGFANAEEFGASVAGCGDATGDGIPDVAVGVPRATTTTTRYGGAVHLYNGATGASHAGAYGAQHE